MKLRKSKLPIWVADCETDPFEFGVVVHPFIWGIYDGENYHEFVGSGPDFRCTHDDLKAFVDFVKDKEIILYAHNGGKFDWHFLTEFMEPETEMLVIAGRLSRFNIGKCEFRDSFNLIPVSLDRWQKSEFDYTKMHKRFRAEYMDEIKTYLKSDCINLYEMIRDFESQYGMHITQAQAAMHLWQYKFKNPVPRSGPTFYDTFSEFYFGGRVQCFQFGDMEGDALSIDINSAYPYAMKFPHPYSLG